MEEAYYTHSRWLVKPGREAEFIEAWREMGAIFSTLPDAIGHGTLIRSLEQPNLFYAFGPWPSLEAIQGVRTDPRAQQAMGRAHDLCDESHAAAYEVAALVRP
jgi:heme-degrading monooxygenase HmoA